MLRHFQAESLWLLDASVHATYRGVGNGLPEGQRRLHDDVAGELHIQWWTRYGKPLINYLREKEDQELSVWIVGETLHKRLMRHNHPLTDFPDTHKRWIGLNQPPENEKTYYKERVMKALQH